jgi:hypothetical protein
MSVEAGEIIADDRKNSKLKQSLTNKSGATNYIWCYVCAHGGAGVSATAMGQMAEK